MKFSGFRILKSLKNAFLQIFRIQDPESSGSGDPAGKSQEGQHVCDTGVLVVTPLGTQTSATFPLLLVTPKTELLLDPTHPSHATASLHSKTENHRSFQRHHHRYHLSRSSTTIFIFTTDTTYILIICYSPKSQTCHWVQRELTIRVKAKTCVRRDKTFLRAPVGACKTMGNGLAPSWPNKWRWRWVARRGVGG